MTLPERPEVGALSRIRWRHQDCDPTSCVATLEQGCEPTILLGVRADAAEPLRGALAEGLHKAMCFAPATMHNRLACERPQVYEALADAALAHPAMRATLEATAPAPEPALDVERCPLCHEIERVEDIVSGVCLTCAEAIAFGLNARRGAIVVTSDG